MNPLHTDIIDVERISLEDQARLYAKYLRRLASGVRGDTLPVVLHGSQLDRAASLLDVLATRAEQAA